MRDTNITTVLKQLNRSTGSTGAWKAGVLPNLEIVIDISDYLHLPLDVVVYGEDHFKKWFPRQINLTSEQMEWLDLLSQVPPEKMQMCKDFIKTHVVEKPQENAV